MSDEQSRTPKADIYNLEVGRSGKKPAATDKNTENINTPNLAANVPGVGKKDPHVCDGDCMIEHHHASLENNFISQAADTHHPEHKRGVVKHPEQDRRLKQNKNIGKIDFSRAGLSLKEYLELLKRKALERQKAEEIKRKKLLQQTLQPLSHHASLSEIEKSLKDNYKFGKIFADIDSATKDYLMKVYSDLKVEAAMNPNEKEYSEVISQLANLMIEKGYFKK